MGPDKLILRIDHNATYIHGKMGSNVYDKFKKELGYCPENAFWMIKKNAYSKKEAWKRDWDGTISAVCWNQKHCHCHIKKQGLHFPTGLLSKAVNFFRENDIPFQRIDIRNKVEKVNRYSLSTEFEYRDYQKEIIDKVVGNNSENIGINRGIIKCATGAGKTPLSCGIIAGIGVTPVIFYVPSIDLLKQAKDEITKFITENGNPVEVGMIGGGVKEIKNITVMTIQTAVRALGGVWVKYDEEDVAEDDTNIDDMKEEIKSLIYNCRLMICDECLDGNTIIETEKGKIKISDVLLSDCKYVLSHDGHKKVWKKILAFMPMGRKKVLKIKLSSGRYVRCTSNHLFMTKNGWIEAGKMLIGEKVYICDTKLENVISIKEDGSSEVFDIEVEDTHCFFANEILVHNCQHWAAETCQIISDASVSCQYRYAMSVGPDSNLELYGWTYFNGKIISIEDLWGDIIDNSDIKFYKEHDYEIVNIKNLNLYSRGWSEKDNTFTWKKINKIIRHKCNKKARRIYYRGKNSLLVTDDHSIFYVPINSKKDIYNFKCSESCDIDKKDVLIADNGKEWEKVRNIEKFDIFEFLKNNHKNSDRIRVKVDLSGLSHKDLNISYSRFYQMLRRKSGIDLHSYIQFKDILPLPEKIYTEGGRGVGICPNFNFEFISYLMGFFIGDGWFDGNRINFAVENSILNQFLNYINNINSIFVNPKIRKMEGNSCEVRISNSLLSCLMKYFLGEKYCYEKRIPSKVIFEWNKFHKMRFINGMMHSDGCFSVKQTRNKKEARYTTTSYNLVKDFSTLLRSLGVSSSLSIREPRKGGIINKRQIIGRRESYQIIFSMNSLFGINNGYNGEVKRFKNINCNEYIVNSVKEEIFDDYVYDLEMEGHPSFVANGVLVHNSATPYRDKGDDILIEGCFGRTIADINASLLIKKGFLIKPKIYFSKISNMRGMKKTSYPNVYKQAVVENEARNNQIVSMANRFYESGRKVLILVKHIAHGKLLESLIPNSIFLHGSTSKKKRQEHLDLMREGSPQITITSSLPYEELIFIKYKGAIRQIEIGDLCDNYKEEIKNGEIMTVCSFNGKTREWGKIINGYKHKRENKIVHVITNKNEDIYVTENHSLVNSDLNQILPKLNEVACVPYGSLKQEKNIQEIDLIDLFRNINDSSLEVEVLGITQGKIRTLKKHLSYLNNKKDVCKSSRSKFSKQIKNYDEDDYKEALTLFFKYFKYYKYRYRAKLNDIVDCKIIFKFFNARIFIRRSRKNTSLPIKFNITKSFALISGLLCGDGHIKNHLSGKSIYTNCFAGLKDMSKSTEGKHDINKKNVRQIFKKNFNDVFNDVIIRESNKALIFNGKLLFYLFKELGHINNKGEKMVPFYIYNADRDIQESFLYGMYLSDGCKRYNTKENRLKDEIGAIVITNTSRPLVSGLSFLLRNMQMDFYLGYHEHRQEKWKSTYHINICSDFSFIKMSRKISKIHMNNIERTQKKIVYLEDRDDDYVYDISVKGCHNFVAGVGGILAHNTIFDEGIDCRPLDTLILAGAGKSATRALQRIGRILRPYPGKTDAVAIDFMDNCKYMQAHSTRRANIYKTEEEFDIEIME